MQDDLQLAVRESAAIRMTGGGTKSALSERANRSAAALTGVVEYDPQEFTVTIRSGTTLRDLHDLLGENRQHLAFDPPFRASGGTVGGTVAAGLSGPGRLQFGGIRDFILGVEFIDGRGELLRGGGRVVKNAAGFDFPKLMVGALGEFGILTSVTFKVFPRPEANRTVRASFGSLHEAVVAAGTLYRSPLQPAAIEIHPPETLYVRFSGSAAASHAGLRRALEYLGTDTVELQPESSRELWHGEREFEWAQPAHALVKAAINPLLVSGFDSALTAVAGEVPRRYGVAGHVAHFTWPDRLPASALNELLTGMGVPGLVLRGSGLPVRPGLHKGGSFAGRIRKVLDPDGKFLMNRKDNGST